MKIFSYLEPFRRGLHVWRTYGRMDTTAITIAASYDARSYTRRPKLHYTDKATDMLYNTTNGHHQRTSSQQFYNKFATSQCQSPTSRHVKMLGCGKFVSVAGEFVVQQVVELLWARPLVVSVGGVVLYNMSVAGVRVVEFSTNELSGSQILVNYGTN